MAVKIVSRKYRNQFHTNSEDTDWLLGNVGDWQQLILRVEVTIDFFASNQESVQVDVRNKQLILNNGRKWSDYGFDIGDVVEFRFRTIETDENGMPDTNSYVSNLTILNLFGSTMEHNLDFSNGVLAEISLLPTNRGTIEYKDVEFRSTKTPEGLKFNYSHLTNSDFDSNNLASLIDGTVPEFSFSGLNNVPFNVTREMNPDGFQSGMAIESAFVTPRAKNGDAHVYDIAVNFMMGKFFDIPTDFEGPTPPASLFDIESLTDNFLIRVFPEWNNPNTVISNDLSNTERLGNTGWFNENFNGLDNNFTIDSVTFTDVDGNPMTELDYTKPTIVEIEASGIPNLSSDTELGFGFAWVPQNEDDYFNKETPFHQNLLMNTGRIYDDGVNDSFNLGEDIGSMVLLGFGQDARMDVEQDGTPLFIAGGADKVVFKAKFVPNPSFINFFNDRGENDRQYILWLSVADHDLAINFSDRVSLLARYGTLTRVIAPAGPYPGMTSKFIEHPQSEGVEGADKYFGFVEDDVLSRVRFSTELSTNNIINSMSFGYEVKDVDSGLSYSLENIAIPLDGFPKDPDGIQQFNIDQVRGFKLESGNNKNFVKILRDEANDTTGRAHYTALFASKIRWEEWLSRDGVPDLYFDSSKENNGQHNDWLDYLRAGNIDSKDFFFVVYTEVVEDGELVVYKNEFELTFNGYDENLNIETTHEYFRDSDNTLLNVGTDPDTGKPLGAILSDEPTRIEITYENLTEDFDFDFMYATICLEVDRGAGEFEFRQLSSRWGSESDNPLIPLNGENRLKMELVSPRVIKTSCLIDPNRLEQVLRYKISGRLGCWAESPGVPVTQGLYEARYESIYE